MIDGGAPRAASTASASAATFADDLAFLQRHGSVIVLSDLAGGLVALSAKYQGRVMTSAVEPGGRSLGFVHRAFIEAGKTATPFDNYGGEDRFWLGPEGGQFGLYFPKGAAFDFDRWQTPHELQEGEWSVQKSTSSAAVFTKAMRLSNWSGTTFELDVERAVTILASADTRSHLGLPLPAGVRTVAFETRNKITNRGKRAWTKETGLLSIWILAMYAPSKDARAIVPFRGRSGDAGPIVNDLYFGKVPAERLVVREDEGHLLFSCDGTFRSKIGLRPDRAKNVLGSYSASAKELTVVTYDLPPNASGLPYVNSMWEKQPLPYAGDVINAYNDGPPAPGKPSLGGFYELETSSPGAALASGASLVFTQRTFHFVGDEASLDPIAKHTLGVSLARVR